MNYLKIIPLIVLCSTCSSGQKLIKEKTQDGGIAIVEQDYFSGIHHLYVEKKIKSRIQYKLLFRCECGQFTNSSLTKEHHLGKGVTVWRAVTDTLPKPVFYNEDVNHERFPSMQFMPITEEEKHLLESAVRKVTEECCRNLKKPMKEVIGYVRLR